MTRYGFDFGTGVATALVGLALVLIGVAAIWLGASIVIRRAAIALALIELILVSVHVARIHVLAEYLVFGPEVGLIAVTAGATVSMAGAALLRPRERKGGAT